MLAVRDFMKIQQLQALCHHALDFDVPSHDAVVDAPLCHQQERVGPPFALHGQRMEAPSRRPTE